MERVLPTTANSSETSLTGSHKTSILSSFRKDVVKTHADIPVCMCSFVSGLCDSVAFNAATVFVSMQTGNTIFLALGTASLPSNIPLMWLRALCSIIAFIIGVFTFGQTRRIRPIAKGTLAGNFFVQGLFIWAAAILAQTGTVPVLADIHIAEEYARQEEVDLVILAPIMLLAFQFGGQIVVSRQLGFNEVPTNVLTSIYCDIFNDPELAAPLAKNPKRNRRVAAVVLMLSGGICGGWIGRSEAGMGAALWAAGAIKMIMSISFACWRVVDETVGDKE